MKYIASFIIFLLCAGCVSIKHYSTYQFDNGDDCVKEGMFRIVNDETGKIGYANTKGIILIEPQYAFGCPFENGRAKVTYKGENRVVSDSHGEYHYWDSDEWFYIDKAGNKVAE